MGQRKKLRESRDVRIMADYGMSTVTQREALSALFQAAGKYIEATEMTDEAARAVMRLLRDRKRR